MANKSTVWLILIYRSYTTLEAYSDNCVFWLPDNSYMRYTLDFY